MTNLTDKFDALRIALRAFQDEDNGWLESIRAELLAVRGFTYLTDEDIKAQKPILEAIRDNTAVPVGSTDMSATNALLSDIRQALGANGVLASLISGQSQDLTNMAASLASIDAGIGVIIDWYYDWQAYTENATAAVMQAAQMAAVERLQKILQSISTGVVHPEGGRTVLGLLNSIEGQMYADPGPVLANIAERQDETLDAIAALQTTMDACCDDGGGPDVDPCADATGELPFIVSNNPTLTLHWSSENNSGGGGVDDVYTLYPAGYMTGVSETPDYPNGQFSASEPVIFAKGNLIDAVRNDGTSIFYIAHWDAATDANGFNTTTVPPGECVPIPRAELMYVSFYAPATEERSGIDGKLLQVALG